MPTLRAGSAAVTTGSSTATTRSFTVPSGTASGDLIQIFVYTALASRTFTASGYSVIAFSGSGTHSGAFLYKTAVSGDLGGSVTVTISGAATVWGGIIWSVEAAVGFDPTPSGLAILSTASNSAVPNSVTSTGSSDLAVWVAGVRSGSAGGTPATVTLPVTGSGNTYAVTSQVAQSSTTDASVANVGVILGTAASVTAGTNGGSTETGSLSISDASAALWVTYSDSSSTPVTGADTGAGTDTGSVAVAVSGADTGAGTDTGATTITNSFEGGSNGTAISTANSGGTSGTPFDSLGGSATLPVFSTAAAIHGTLGASTPLSSNSTTTLEWKAAFGGFNSSSVPWYARDYFKITSLPPVQVFLMKAQDDGAPQDVWAVYLDTTGHLGLRDRVNALNLATSTGTVALNTPTRWETQCSYDGSTYSLTLRCFFGANVEGTTPDETLTGSISTADAVDIVAFGAQSATSTTWSTVQHDDWALSGAGWIGPVPAGPSPGADTGAGTDTATVGVAVSDADTGAGADTATVGVAVAGADTGTGTDLGSVGVSGADTGAGTDTGSVAVAVSGADTGAGTDTATVGVAVAGADTGAGTDTATVGVPVSGSDTGTGTDTATVGVAVAGADTGAGTDTAAGPAVAVSDADTGALTDSGFVGEQLAGSDSGTGTDTGSVAVAVSGADTATGTDAGSLPGAGSAHAGAFLIFFP